MHKGCECRGRLILLFGVSFIILLVQPLIFHEPVIFAHSVSNPIETYSHSLNPHDPISITKADDFENLGFEGNGTEANPYLIRDLSIEAVDAVGGICISVVSTSVYFVIQNCELFSKDDKTGTGIYFEKVVNGVISGCSIRTLSIGISVLKSERCVFKENELSGLGKGMYQSQSIWISIEKNTITESGYGLHLYKMDYSEVEGNFINLCSYGVLIENGVEILTQSNQIAGSFFGLYFHNSLRGSSFRDTIQNSQYGLYVAYSQECNITLCEMVGSKYGVALLEVDQGVISSSLIRANSEHGIYLKNTRNVKIISNTVFDNSRVGVYLLGVSGATIHQNEIGYNGGSNAADFIGTAGKGLLNNWDTNAWSNYGGASKYQISGDRGSFDNDPHYILYLDSPTDMVLEGPANGVITWFASAFKPDLYSIKENGVVVDEGAWDGGNITISFSRQDLGDYVFSVIIETQSGISMSDMVIVTVQDTTSPDWLYVPEDQTVECGNSLRYQLEVSDYYGISEWWVNDTEFSIEAGLLKNMSILQYGIYHLEVRAYDPSGNYASCIFCIAVVDTVLPSIDSPDDIIFTAGETGNSISWTVFDYNPSRYEILKDGVIIQSGEWTSDMKMIQYSLDDLSPGTHAFMLILYDIAENSISNDVQVTIEEPITTETPTTSMSTEPVTSPKTTDTEMAGLNILTLGILGLGACFVSVIILFVYKRKL